MACRSSWGLVQRLSISSSFNPQAGIRSVNALSWANNISPLRVPAFSKCIHHRTPTCITRYGSLLEKPWQRMSTTKGRSWIIGIQSCSLSTSSDDNSKPTPQPTSEQNNGSKPKGVKKMMLHENIYTLPNFLTVTRLVSAPVIGYWVLQGEYTNAAILFGIACVTDGLDGWIARRFNMQSIVGTILDPMADKTLMTILTVTLAMQNLIPIPIAAVILGRDAGLILSSFYYRYISLPEPKTFKRYWDFSIPSAEVRPTTISKVNTAVQMGYICLSLLAPVFDFTGHIGLEYLGNCGNEDEIIKARSESESMFKCLRKCPPLLIVRLPVGTTVVIFSAWIMDRKSGAYVSKVKRK
ncbi:hypothetical protein BGZ76_010780 [Entomortierella beljakovae]|nr:hypothetical protein BGZ76_010780 [Entomortierella beljakovae]